MQSAQLAIQGVLNARLTEIRSRNPRYSLRAYANRVGVHVGALSSIMNGRRNVSRSLAERIVDRLMLDPEQRAKVLAQFPETRAYRKLGRTSPPTEPRYLELNAAYFKIAAEWEHFAVMSLIRCEDAEASPTWFARRLGITETRARQVLDRLIKYEIIVVEESGKLRRSQKSYRTTDDVASVMMKQHHDQTLELAKTSLHRDDVATRDFTTTTMAIDVRKLGTAKEIIRKFQDDLSDLLESGQPTEVYRLSVQLFPLSHS